MRMRSRSSVPPITGTAMPAMSAQSAAETMMSIKAAPRASATPSGTWRLVGLRGHRDQRLELEEALLADPLDVHQFLDALEAAALGAELEDALGGLAADAGKRLELFDRGGVEIERGSGRRGRGRGCGLCRDERRADKQCAAHRERAEKAVTHVVPPRS